MSDTALINNWLFAAMAPRDQDALRPQLIRQEVAQGQVLLRAGDSVEVIHFPVSAQIANVMRFGSGQSLAVSTVGREGVTGLAAFMAAQPLTWDAVAHISGVVWALPASSLREQAHRNLDLGELLLQATHQNQVEAHARALCATFHPIVSRLARWLLTMQERAGLSSFTMTQDHFAQLLGVRRTTVVAAFGTLSASGALARATRGRVVIKDREVLRSLSCCGLGCRSSPTSPSRSPLRMTTETGAGLICSEISGAMFCSDAGPP